MDEEERSTRVCGLGWDIEGWYVHCWRNKGHEGGHSYHYLPTAHQPCVCHCHRIGECVFACCGCTCTEEVLLEDVAKGRINKELAAKIIEAGVEKGPGRKFSF
jgi:hypothetical protein